MAEYRPGRVEMGLVPGKSYSATLFSEHPQVWDAKQSAR